VAAGDASAAAARGAKRRAAVIAAPSGAPPHVEEPCGAAGGADNIAVGPSARGALAALAAVGPSLPSLQLPEPPDLALAAGTTAPGQRCAQLAGHATGANGLALRAALCAFGSPQPPSPLPPSPSPPSPGPATSSSATEGMAASVPAVDMADAGDADVAMPDVRGAEACSADDLAPDAGGALAADAVVGDADSGDAPAASPASASGASAVMSPAPPAALSPHLAYTEAAEQRVSAAEDQTQFWQRTWMLHQAAPPPASRPALPSPLPRGRGKQRRKSR